MGVLAPRLTSSVMSGNGPLVDYNPFERPPSNVPLSLGERKV